MIGDFLEKERYGQSKIVLYDWVLCEFKILLNKISLLNYNNNHSNVLHTIQIRESEIHMQT